MATDLFKLVPAGYVVRRENSYIIYGAGRTEEEAFNAAREFMELENSRGYYTVPATDALISVVQEFGGTIDWGMYDGIACTSDEQGAAEETKAYVNAMVYAANKHVHDATTPTRTLFEEVIAAEKSLYDAEEALLEAQRVFDEAQATLSNARMTLEKAKKLDAHPKSPVSLARCLEISVVANKHRIQLSEEGNPVIIFDDAIGQRIVLTDNGELKYYERGE